MNIGHIKTLYIFTLVSLLSCNNLEREKKKQVYPLYNYDLIKELKIYDINEDEEQVINGFDQIDSFKEIMKDSTNYFLEELITPKGVKADYSITIFSEQDTLDLAIFPTSEVDKIKIGFFESIDLENPNDFRRFNNFYMNKKLIEFIYKYSN